MLSKPEITDETFNNANGEPRYYKFSDTQVLTRHFSLFLMRLRLIMN